MGQYRHDIFHHLYHVSLPMGKSSESPVIGKLLQWLKCERGDHCEAHRKLDYSCHSIARALLISSRPLASSMFAPGIPDVMSEFHSTNTQLASFVVSVYVLGYAFGPLIIAPLSELYGRLIIYPVCNVMFVIVTVACAVSSNLNMLIGFRFLEGTFGSCPLTIGGGSIADMIPQEKRGGVMAIWALGPLLGPVIGPVIGGYLSQAKGWRWVFWLIAIIVSKASSLPKRKLKSSGRHNHHFSSLLSPRILPSCLARTQSQKTSKGDRQPGA